MSACMIHLVPQSSCFGGIILELLIPLYQKVRDKSIEKSFLLSIKETKSFKHYIIF